MSKFDCENRTDSCDNATICPCMNYIDKERRSYSELLISKKLHTFTDEQLAEHDKQIRADAIDDCLVLVDKIMPPEPYLLKSKHYENWKMKTRELRMLRDMLEQLKGAENE